MTGNSNFITAGKLISELRRFEQEHAESDVVCCLPDGTACCVTGTTLDRDGDLCILIEEEGFDGAYYDVDMLLFELDSYDADTKAYMDAPGLYLSFMVLNDSSVFSYDDENDYVICDTTIAGKYEVTQFDDSYEKQLLEKIHRKARRERIAETVGLAVITAVLAYGAAYNIASILKHSCTSNFESIVWAIVCSTLFVICSLTLYYSKDN